MQSLYGKQANSSNSIPLTLLQNIRSISLTLIQIDKIPYDSFAHKTLLDLFNQYAIIGGMPEVVSNFIEKESLAELPNVYESILDPGEEAIIVRSGSCIYTSGQTK